MSDQSPANRPCAMASLGRLGLDGSSRVVIVGLGKTGLSTAVFLSRFGIPFVVTDTRVEPPGIQEYTSLFPLAEAFPGGFHRGLLAEATHLVVSPGVSMADPFIAEAVSLGIPVMGDIDLFACAAQAPIIAITGANGKSTVTTLLGLMAQASGIQARVGGNLGTPMLDLLDDQAELYVLELSSFQLERARLFEADAAVVLNISPDHMDRYDNLEAYAAAKELVYQGKGVMILNRDDSLVASMAKDGRQARWFSIGTEDADYRLGLKDGETWLYAQGDALMPVADIRLHGRHNLSNALAAVALAECAGVSRVAMVECLSNFTGLEHRMQQVAELDGVTWINDSKATNIGACIAALSGIESKAVLIAGGDGKGADFNEMRPAVAEKVKSLVLMGRDAALIGEAVGDLAPVRYVSNMKEAVLAARQMASAGDVVLLAPACASLDQYRDYQERGRLFAEAVMEFRA